jgi:hypothetical protein
MWRAGAADGFQWAGGAAARAPAAAPAAAAAAGGGDAAAADAAAAQAAAARAAAADAAAAEAAAARAAAADAAAADAAAAEAAAARAAAARAGGGAQQAAAIPHGTERPPLGAFIDRGADGTVYMVEGQANQVIKVFHMARQVQNELANLARARGAPGVLPENVVTVLQQGNGWLVKEFVTRVTPNQAQAAEGLALFRALVAAGVDEPTIGTNLVFGYTANNPTPRWILLE